MKLIVLLALIAIAFAYPTINDNFSSLMTTTRSYHNHTEKFTDTIYEWFSGKQRRFDSTRNGTKFSVYQFATNHTQYTTVVGNCQRREFNEPWFPFFDWVKDAYSNGSCIVGKSTGVKWVDETQGRTAVLCASSNTPLSLEIEDRRGGFHDSIVFNTFHPGNPSPSSFQTPSACWNR